MACTRGATTRIGRVIATRRSTLLFLAIAALVAGGCKRDTAATSSTSATGVVQPFDHRFTITIGGQPVRMRLAVKPFEQERGLMQVPAMPEDEGMIFVY